MESRHEVCVVQMLDLSRTAGSTHSRLSTLRVELDSHADTCVVGKNALVIHAHPKVAMVSGFDPLQPPRRQCLCGECLQHVSDMLPCHDNVGKIW